MRRQDRAMLTEEEILHALDGCDTIRLALNSETYPYIVPLFFGWEKHENGRVYLYVHGAREGLRHTLLQRDWRVCVEADRCLGFVKVGEDCTCAYESIIGFGRAEVVAGEEALHGLKLILQHCGFDGEPVPENAAVYTSVWKITISQMTGKRRTV